MQARIDLGLVVILNTSRDPAPHGHAVPCQRRHDLIKKFPQYNNMGPMLIVEPKIEHRFLYPVKNINQPRSLVQNCHYL